MFKSLRVLIIFPQALCAWTTISDITIKKIYIAFWVSYKKIQIVAFYMICACILSEKKHLALQLKVRGLGCVYVKRKKTSLI